MFDFGRACVACVLAAVSVFVVAGCGRGDGASGKTVVLYTSVDQTVAGPILKRFEERTGVKVVIKTDTEATKTAGLAERLVAERDRPQADVWWGNEVFYTVRLAEAGVLMGYESPAYAEIPGVFRDVGNKWAGVGLRARVIAVAREGSKGRTGESANGRVGVKGLEDLTDARLKGKVAMARPTAGTTGGHVAALYVLWGRERADAYFRALHANGVVLVGGNSVVADEVGKGNFLAGLTDNDDVTAAQREGGKLDAVLPDQEGVGTLMIPTTVGLVNGAQHQEAARKLIDYLLSGEVERELIERGFAGYSVRAGHAVKPMQVDYAKVAAEMPGAIRRATGLLEGRE